jgi:predicted DNA binding CopG/RHH family protein
VQSKNVTIRMDEKTFQAFKEVSAREGIPYQTKIKDVMREYIDRVNRIYKDEEERNNKTKGI